LFQDSQDIALALSTDGAQLTMKKQSNTWLLILIVLNLTPEIWYTSGDVIMNLATPGPNSPRDIKLFLHPLLKEMAQASEGL
jgi:Transposase family tnp2